MAVIYAYPTVVPELQDLLIGTEITIQGGEDAPKTRTFTIQSIVDLVENAAQTIPTLQQVTTANKNTTVGITASTNANGAVPIKGVVNWEGIGSQNNVAVLGEVGIYGSTPGIGVKGFSPQGVGVQGESSENHGVRGISTSLAGVKGEGDVGVLGVGNYGIRGLSTAFGGIGVYGEAGTGAGVYGKGYSGYGGHFTSENVDAIFAEGSIYATLGVQAQSFVKTGGSITQYLMANGDTSTMPTLQQVTTAQNTTTVGISATTNANLAIPIKGINIWGGAGMSNNFGVYGESTYEGVGVKGVSSTGYGVHGYSSSAAGVYGVGGSDSSIAIGTGVFGIGGNYGVHGVGEQNAGGFFTTNNGSLALISDGPAGKPGGGTWDTYSDSRIKQNVTPYTKGLAEILLVNTVNFEYNGLANTKVGIGYVGIIAQDMKDAFPETVSTYKTKLNKEDEEETELYMFNANALTFALINAVKQLNAEIELLKSK